jgi:LSD1 subclass zinc finger protein
MSDVIECSNCKNQLQLPPSMIGKRVKCPLCNNIFVARLPGADPNQPTAYNLTSQPEIPPTSREPEQSSGPERTSEPEREDDTNRGRSWSSRQERRREYDEDEDDDYRRRKERRDRDRQRERDRGSFDFDDREGRPHRGGQILAMSIIGLLCFGIILGPVAWGMAVSDLNSMSRGHMDRSGEGATRAGMIIGIIATFTHLMCCGVNLLWIVAAA